MSPRSYTTVSEKSFQHRQGELGETVDINKTEDGITINGVPLLGSDLDDFCNWLDPTAKEVCAELEATDELVEELGLAAKKLELRAKAAEDRVRALERSNAMEDATRYRSMIEYWESASSECASHTLAKGMLLDKPHRALQYLCESYDTLAALEQRAKDAEAKAQKFQAAGKELVQHNDRHFNNARRLHGRVEELERLLKASEANVEGWKAAWQAAVDETGDLPEEVPICRFYETVRIDVHEGAFSHPAVDAMTLLGVKDAKRFEKHCCRMTFEALFPIGPPADVSKPEGRDS